MTREELNGQIESLILKYFYDNEDENIISEAYSCIIDDNLLEISYDFSREYTTKDNNKITEI